MNETKPSADTGQQKRRRVLRGVVAAPVVLTISSGASATMKSNMRCIANQVNNAGLPRTYGAGTGVPATVIRVQLYKNSAGTRFFFSGTELQGLAHPSRPVSWISIGQWQEFSKSTNSHVGSPTTSPPTLSPCSPPEYANVQMDQNGYILSVGKNNSTTTSLMAGTCWNSFRAGPI